MSAEFEKRDEKAFKKAILLGDKVTLCLIGEIVYGWFLSQFPLLDLEKLNRLAQLAELSRF
jgi:hypothetical protein